MPALEDATTVGISPNGDLKIMVYMPLICLPPALDIVQESPDRTTGGLLVLKVPYTICSDLHIEGVRSQSCFA